MLRVDFKKCPCHPVDYRIKGPNGIVRRLQSIRNNKYCTRFITSGYRGGSWGGGGVGVLTPSFWGTPKLHKEGKNVVCVRTEMPRFST